MRWIIFILLLLGVFFSLSALAPTAQPGLLWPFAADSKSIAAFAGGAVTTLLAGVAVVLFLAALIGLFWKAVPSNFWPALVIVGAIAALLLHILYFSVWMIVPIVVDAVLLWGVLTKRWTAESLPVRTITGDTAPIHPLMNIPVPWVFILTFLIGIGLQYLLPLTINSANTLTIIQLVGFVLVIIGVVVAFSSLGIFRAKQTTTVPFEKPTNLITWGPYRFSRNPMYVSLSLIYLGVAGTQGQIWPIILLPFTLVYINWVVIPYEEEQLRKVFGADYEKYSAGVRRWL